MARTYPYALAPVHGPFPADKLAGAADGMGTYGDATRELVANGVVQPDLICGMTLALISDQPSFRGPTPRTDGKVSGTDGGVWVRERFTIHRPVALDDAWTVEGEATGTYVVSPGLDRPPPSRSYSKNGTVRRSASWPRWREPGSPRYRRGDGRRWPATLAPGP